MTKTNFLKKDWEKAKFNLTNWWQGTGIALSITAPRDTPRGDLKKPEEPADLKTRWTDPDYRLKKAEYIMANTFFGAEAFPYFDTQIGPGNLATFIGSEPGFAEDTVWYNQSIDDPDSYPELEFNPENKWYQNQMAIIKAGLARANGRYLVGMPDLVENIDILASLRGSENLLMDFIERPTFVRQKVQEINQIYFTIFDSFYNKIKDKSDGNAFSAFKIWGSGKTAKVQCDTAAMFSPQMFADFVVPSLSEQCQWLDYSMFHLDGTQCFCQLDLLLKIDDLNAIEWTPQAGIAAGGSPEWYDLYKKILSAGKSVQAIGVKPNEVIPLLNAVGTNGIFIMTSAESEAEARVLIDKVEKYR